LAVVLIFGLLSSTFLVITVFPYYYLGAEYLRMHIRTRDFFAWLVLTVIVAAAVMAVGSTGLGLLVFPLSVVFVSLLAFYRRRLA
jgi:hypothetical protein